MPSEPIPDNYLPLDDHRLQALLRGPRLDTEGKIIAGTYDGMTPDEVMRQRDSYRRMVGE